MPFFSKNISKLEQIKSINSTILLLLLSAFIFWIAVGINIVIMPALLIKNDISATKIGIASIFELSGSIIMSFVLHKIVKKLGVSSAVKYATIIYAVIVLISYFFLGFFFWLAIALSTGFCWFICTIIRQFWLNSLVNNRYRGLLIGAFSMIISFGLVIGPAIVSLTSADNYFNFVLSAFLLLLSYYILQYFCHTKLPEISEQKYLPLKELISKHPNLASGRFFLDFICFSFVSFVVVFATKKSLTPEQGCLFYAAFSLSGILDLIVGILLVKYPKPQKMLNIGFIICLCGSFLLFCSGSFGFFTVIFFLIGCGIACIFVTCYKMLNDEYSNENSDNENNRGVAANATFQRIGSIGAMCGSITTGIAIDLVGANGLAITVLIASICYFITFQATKIRKIAIAN